MLNYPNRIVMVKKDILNQPPPQNLEAEMCVLGSLLLDSEMIGVVVQLLSKEDFYLPAHTIIYNAILTLYSENKVVDLVILKEELQRNELLEEVGGASYLATLAEAVPSSANIEYYAKIVKDKSITRNLIAVAHDVITDAYEKNEKAMDIVIDAEKRLWDLVATNKELNIKTIREVLDDKKLFFRDYIRTGFLDLDRIIGGFLESKFYIIGGTPSCGKTSFVLNLMLNLAKRGHAVMLFSYEMDAKTLAENMLCIEGEIDTSLIVQGLTGEEDWKEAKKRIQGLPISINDSHVPIESIRVAIQRYKQTHNLRVVFIDYLQNMPHRVEDNLRANMESLTKDIKKLVTTEGVPIVGVSALTRFPSERTKPRMSDLKESSALEYGGDVIVLLYKKADGITGVEVAKHRIGKIGETTLAFKSQFFKFLNLETEKKEY